MNPYIIQSIGFLALFFVVVSFQRNNRSEILSLIVVAQFLFALHFGLLQAYTAMGVNIIAAFRGIVFIKRKEKIWLYVFIFLFIISGYYTWEGYRSVLPVSAMIIETIGFWIKEPSKIRFVSLFPRPFWLSYNVLVFSIPGIICELFVLSSLLVGIFRYDKKNYIQKVRSIIK